MSQWGAFEAARLSPYTQPASRRDHLLAEAQRSVFMLSNVADISWLNHECWGRVRMETRDAGRIPLVGRSDSIQVSGAGLDDTAHSPTTQPTDLLLSDLWPQGRSAETCLEAAARFGAANAARLDAAKLGLDEP